MRTISLLGLALFVSSVPADDPGTMRRDWPQWRGPLRDGKSSETGLLQKWPEGGPTLLWKAKEANNGTAVGTGWSSVSVAKGRIFTMGDHVSVTVVDDKGKAIAAAQVKKVGGKDVAVDANGEAIAKAKITKSGAGFVYALDENTGKMLWSTKISQGGGDGPRCTPTVDDDRVYALSRYGDLVCLGLEKGEIIWKTNFKKDFGGRMMSGWDYSESPLIDGDKLICTPGADSAALAALDKKTGEVLWKAEIPKCGGAGYASPVIAEVAGIRQYITLLGHSRGLVGVAAKDGKFLWNYNKMANGTANIPTAIVKGDLVFASTGYDAGAALLQLVPDGKGGITAQEKYFLKGNVLQNHHGGMILFGDHIYGGHGKNNGLPFCLDLTSGKFAWPPQRGAGTGTAPVVYADGRLYFRYENNVMALVEASPMGYNLVSQFTLPGNLATGWPHPVVANGKLILRCRDQVLCYDVKQK